ncbi:MAG: HK97 gp10 family phage protein [Planctomycetes bacterium]|nr:HK97 gp10 family phage protein [Planctomycetota bacterium]
MSLDIEGIESTQKKMIQTANDLTKTGGEIVKGVGRGALIVQRAAMKAAPVDRGHLRASITPDIVVRDNVVRGVVGSNRVYAAAQELGTKPFWAPWGPLFAWARRKTKGNLKLAGALAAGARRAIARHGIRAKKFLFNAFNENKTRITGIIERAISRTVNK